MPDEVVTAVELGEWLGITDRAVRTHDERGHVVKIAPGRFDLRESILAYCEHLREQAAGRKGEDGAPDLATERARLARAQADTAELKYAAMRSEYIPAATVSTACQTMNSRIRARMLAVPARVKHASAHITDQDRDIIDREIRDALTELAHDRLEYDDTGADDSEGLPAGDGGLDAAPEDEAVGLDGADASPAG